MDFIGNHKAIVFLRKSLEKGNINHAYLFSGPERVGKSTLAKIFAQHLINGTPLSNGIDLYDKDALLDVIFLAPEIVEKNGITKQRDISVEKVRDAKQGLSLFPYKGKYKVLIIEDAHKMNTAAQNALLKILEEPNETSVIILVTHEIDRILPTILSRVQVVNFGLVEDSDMENVFVEQSPLVRRAILYSAGRPGLADFLKRSESELSLREKYIKELEIATEGSLNEKLKLAEELSKDVMQVLDKLDVWIWEMRKKALISDDLERSRIFEKIGLMCASIELLKRTNANSRLILETLFMDI